MRYSKEEKARLLEAWKQSGKSIGAFAREIGLARWTFTKWIKEDRNGEPGFVEIPARAAQPPMRCIQEILIEKGDVKIHIPLALGCDEMRAATELLGGIL
jgi:transposase-like protein